MAPSYGVLFQQNRSNAASQYSISGRQRHIFGLKQMPHKPDGRSYNSTWKARMPSASAKRPTAVRLAQVRKSFAA